MLLDMQPVLSDEAKIPTLPPGDCQRLAPDTICYKLTPP